MKALALAAVALTIAAGLLALVHTARADSVGAPISVGTDPIQEKMTPDDSKLYVSDQGGTVSCPGFPSGAISVIDTTSNAVTSTLGVGVDPGPIRFTSDGSRAYVANQADCDPAGTVSVITTATPAVSATVPVGQFPITLTVSQDNSKVYVANKGSNSVSVICTGLVSAVCASANTVIKTIPLDGTLGINPHVIDKNPSGSEVWVAQQDCPAGTGCSASNVAVISTASDAVIANVGVGPASGSIHFTPDGSRAYVASRGNGALGIPPTVADINTSTHQVTATTTITPPSFPTDAAPHAMRITPDNAKVYVADKHSGDVAVICTGMVPGVCSASDTVLKYITVGTAPDRLEITGDGSRIYAVNQMTGSPAGNVSVICTGFVLANCGGGTADSVIASLTVGADPVDIAINCADTKAYVSNSGSNSVSPLSLTGLGGCSSASPTPGATPSPTPAPGTHACVRSDGTTVWVSWNTPVGDDDCDGFTTTIENFVGTNPLLACGTNAWPPDFNNSMSVNLLDVILLKPHFGTAPPNTNYSQRFDLNADSRVNLTDVIVLKPFFGKTCTP